MSVELMPFGKYKGQPVQVLQQDQKYLDWLRAQDWFVVNHHNLNTIIINNFKEPSQTPEHNKLQAKFLDVEFCDLFLNFVLKNKWVRTEYTREFWEENPKYDPNIHTYIPGSERNPNRESEQQYIKKNEILPINYTYSNSVFEHNSADVFLVYNTNDKESYSYKKFPIELKPYVSDDYPAILRQCKNNKVDYLVAGEFSAIGATLSQVKEIFKRSYIHFILLDEILNS